MVSPAVRDHGRETTKEVGSMTTIRATCPDCGEVDLRPTDIQLTVVRADDLPVAPESRYTFTCPTCTEAVAKPADERIARLLTTGGVDVSVVHRDAAHRQRAPDHPEQPGDGPALTLDDLLDFHLLLQEPDWFDQLV